MKHILLLALLLLTAKTPALSQQPDSLLQKGINFYNNGDYEKSIAALQKRLVIAIAGNEKKVQEVIYNSLGNNYSNTGKTAESMQNYLHAIAIAEELGDKTALAKATKNIGALYADTKDFDKAKIKYDEAEKIALTINDTATIADCANNKGVILEQQKNYAGALTQYTRALRLYEGLKQDERIALCYNNLGIVYKFLGDYNQSIKCYQRSLELGVKLGNKYLIAANQVNMGNVYEMKGDYKKAIELNQQGLQTGRAMNSPELVMEATGNIAEDYAKAGEYKKAFKEYKKFLAVKDSFISIERSKQMAEMQTKYESEKKEKVITGLKQQREIAGLKLAKNELVLQKRNYLIIALVGMSALVMLVLLHFYNRQQLRQKQARVKAVQDAELMERQRIGKDVHDDLGSGLSKISLIANIAEKKTGGNIPLYNDIQNISVVTKELVANMHDLIWVLNPEYSTLDQLVSRLREYCTDYLDNMPIFLALKFPDEVPATAISREMQRNVFLTVKEAINNSVKHSGADKMTITLTLGNDKMQIAVSDNGKGFDMEKLKRGGNGLINMRQRIEQIGGVFEIISTPANTSINIVIGYPYMYVAKVVVQ